MKQRPYEFFPREELIKRIISSHIGIGPALVEKMDDHMLVTVALDHKLIPERKDDRKLVNLQHKERTIKAMKKHITKVDKDQVWSQIQGEVSKISNEDLAVMQKVNMDAFCQKSGMLCRHTVQRCEDCIIGGIDIGKEVSDVVEEAEEMDKAVFVEEKRKRKEKKMKANLVIEAEQINASELVTIVGINVYPVYVQEMVEGHDEPVNVIKDIIVNKGNVEMPINSPLYKYVISKELVVCKSMMKQTDSPLYDQNKSALVNMFIDYVEEKSPEKTVAIAKAAREKAVMYVGLKTTMDKIFSCNVFEQDLSKLTGYCAPRMMNIINSTKDQIKVLVVDSEKMCGQLVHDGNIGINGSLFMETYLSNKKMDAGRKSSILELNAAQMRVFNPAVIKGLGVFSADFHHDLIKSYGFNPEDYDAVTDVANLKGKKYAHGESFEMRISELSFINKLSESATSNIGVQGTCLDPDKFKLLIDEKNVLRSAKIWKHAVDGDAEAMRLLMGIVDPNKTYEDNETAPIKFLSMAIPLPNGRWRVMCHSNNYNTMTARWNDFYKDHILSMNVGSMAFYAIGCPALIKDEQDKLNCALSVFEREYYKETGKLVNFVVCEDNLEVINAFNGTKYPHCYRNPIVAPASVQRATLLPEKYAQRLIDMGFTSIHIRDGIGIHSIKGCLMVSQDYALTCYMDFDGDFVYILQSNRADFGVWRPKYPAGKKGEKAPNPETVHDFNEQLKQRYEISIKGAKNTGIVDLAVRHIIEDWRRLGVYLDPNVINLMGYIREKTIQQIKHVAGKGGVSLQSQDPVEMLLKYAPNGELQPIWTCPETALKHPRMGKGVGKTSNRLYLNDLLKYTRNLKNREAKPTKAIKDAWFDVWCEMVGAKPTLRDQDSTYWQQKFDILWKQIITKQISLPTGHSNFSAGTQAKISKFCTDCNDHYRAVTTDLIGLDDDVRRKGFNDLRKWFYEELSTFLKGMVGHDQTKRLTLRLLITVYFGKIGFGMRSSSRTQESWSLPGYCFWYMGPETINWAVKQIHPNNPFIIDALTESK